MLRVIEKMIHAFSDIGDTFKESRHILNSSST